MTRIMGDSTDVNQIPKNVDLVGTYLDGHMGIVPQDVLEAMFPSDKYFHVLIDVNGSNPRAHVRDWENGDKGGSLEQWVIDHNLATGKKDAVIYCNRETISEVRRLTGSQILGKDYWLWVATLDGTIFQGEGVIACQDKGAKQLGKNWDQSLVFDDNIWPQPVPKPVFQTKPNCMAFQRAIRVPMDDVWGPLTDTAADALIQCWAGKFPSGILYAQAVVGTRGDGFWGPNSKQAMHDTTAQAQRALNSMGFTAGAVDGIWGPNTQKAYDAARKACHI